MLTHSLALINVHFQVGSLILADVIPEPPMFSDSKTRSYNLRICACRSIVNAVELVLQADARSNAPSMFLLDPYPEYMVDALVRTGSSVFLLLTQDNLTRRNVSSMMQPISRALEILSEISYLAAEAVPLIRARSSDMGLDNAYGEPSTASSTVENKRGFHIDPSVCSERLLSVLEQRALEDPDLVNKSVERTEIDILMASLLGTESGPELSGELLTGWDFDVSSAANRGRALLTRNEELLR